MRCAADLRRTQRRPSSPRRVPRGPLQSTPHRPPRQLIPHERGVCPGPGSPAARPGRGSCSRAPRAALTAPPRQIPIGLAGSGSPSAGDVLGSSALGGARSVARGAADASLALPLGSSPVPRVWPMVADALRRAAGTPARAPAAATAGARAGAAAGHALAGCALLHLASPLLGLSPPPPLSLFQISWERGALQSSLASSKRCSVLCRSR